MSQSFADLGVSNAVVTALTKRGFTEPFAVQKLVIGEVLAGRDVLAKSPTGSGKTLAFGVPIVDMVRADGPRPAALILAPTRELATQIADEMYAVAHARALRISTVYGGVGLTKQAHEAKKSHIIVATPGRLEDLLERGAFRLDEIEILVLDEADRMLDMGFRPAVDRIVNACPADRQTLFFSATLDGEAGRVALEYTQDAVRHEHRPPVTNQTAKIEHRFIPVSRDHRIDALVGELRNDRDLALIFVRTKRGADRLVKRLSSQGVNAVAMHGDKSQRQRERALASFEAGRIDTLVATDVAARGIDVDGISHVINFDIPGDRETYVHRTGRTARAGRSGVGITFVMPEERRDVVKMADELGIAHELGSSTRPQRQGGDNSREHRSQQTGGPKRSHAGAREHRGQGSRGPKPGGGQGSNTGGNGGGRRRRRPAAR
jgi:superfamily II DNA/RNA helicase